MKKKIPNQYNTHNRCIGLISYHDEYKCFNKETEIQERPKRNLHGKRFFPLHLLSWSSKQEQSALHAYGDVK